MAFSDPSAPHDPGFTRRPVFVHRLDALARRLVPGGIIVLIVLVLSAPSGLPEVTSLLPSFVIASVFFWSVWRPAIMPAPGILALGLILDLVGFAPLGISALTLLLLHGVTLQFRYGLMRLSFMFLWIVFSFSALLTCLLQLLLTSLLGLALLPPQPAFFEAALAVGIYPLLAVFYTRVNRALHGPGQE
ncbi:MAG: rod shape-determining protein MreD [Acetobacter sp.]|jgi:rod shape-determining protein MreD|nr:rod shape-determining protein MreD [Acetobacter sp.]MCH4059928.1 rod shape-determining protein MreD [Acetobacter sp.]MCH4086869.1 rod shape-determining protein MreD [Acetobacter sp.]MCI1294311.1 rod shape-determining protein MreD [Acetobacter sp.]MCI1320961.1 rod shape-determining protein MreD [Acetobacter sp.]